MIIIIINKKNFMDAVHRLNVGGFTTIISSLLERE